MKLKSFFTMVGTFAILILAACGDDRCDNGRHLSDPSCPGYPYNNNYGYNRPPNYGTPYPPQYGGGYNGPVGPGNGGGYCDPRLSPCGGGFPPGGPGYPAPYYPAR